MRPIDADALTEFLKCLLPERGMWEIEGDTVKNAICETVAEAIEMVKNMETIHPEKAQLSQDGTTFDMIDRQQAINGKIAIQRANGVEIYSDEAVPVEYLKALPPAQPEPHWIPVSERMPEEHEWIGTKKFGTTISDEVYVTFENEKGERFCKHLSFQNGKLSRYDKLHMDTWYKGSKPIAWVPLPEPYQKGVTT